MPACHIGLRGATGATPGAGGWGPGCAAAGCASPRPLPSCCCRSRRRWAVPLLAGCQPLQSCPMGARATSRLSDCRTEQAGKHAVQQVSNTLRVLPARASAAACGSCCRYAAICIVTHRGLANLLAFTSSSAGGSGGQRHVGPHHTSTNTEAAGHQQTTSRRDCMIHILRANVRWMPAHAGPAAARARASGKSVGQCSGGGGGGLQALTSDASGDLDENVGGHSEAHREGPPAGRREGAGRRQRGEQRPATPPRRSGPAPHICLPARMMVATAGSRLMGWSGAGIVCCLSLLLGWRSRR